MVLTDVIQYTTFRQHLTTFDVFRTIYKSHDVVVLVKAENAGKKDSLILMNSIMLGEEFTQLRADLLHIFNLSHFDYMFHTDADTLVEENALYNASTVLANN